MSLMHTFHTFIHSCTLLFCNFHYFEPYKQKLPNGRVRGSWFTHATDGPGKQTEEFVLEDMKREEHNCFTKNK